jgi:hypothetical protein
MNMMLMKGMPGLTRGVAVMALALALTGSGCAGSGGGGAMAEDQGAYTLGRQPGPDSKWVSGSLGLHTQVGGSGVRDVRKPVR